MSGRIPTGCLTPQLPPLINKKVKLDHQVFREFVQIQGENNF
jgi:hypothetical protein